VGQHGGGHDLHEVGVALLHGLDAARPGGAVGDEDLTEAERRILPPLVASGFVCSQDQVQQALAGGAIAVSTSDCGLW
jgi:glycerol-3-phosphate responsive antiterminator